MAKQQTPTPEVEVEEYSQETLQTTVTKAAEALDDRKNKLGFARQVESARKAGIPDADFAVALTAARVARILPGVSDPAAIAKVASDRKLEMSSSKVSQYGVALGQLREAKAPITESTFDNWFRLASTGGTADLRKEMVTSHLEEERSQEEKESYILEKSVGFTKKPRVSEPKLTLEKVEAFLAKVLETDFGADKQAVVDALIAAGAQLDDQPVEAEVITQAA